MSSLINSVVTCVQKSSILNWNTRLCVVQQLLGARAAWSQGVCLVDVLVSDLMPGGSEQPQRGPEQLAEAKQTCVLCLLVGFTCLKAVPRCFQLFAVFVSQKMLD